MSDEEFWATVRGSRPAARHDPVADALLERIIAGDHVTNGPAVSRRGRWLSAGPVMAALGVCVAVAVALAVLVGHHGSGSVGRGSNGAPGSTVSGSSMGTIVARAPDPSGGLPWGLRAVRTTRGRFCLDVGRLQNGMLGTLGIDGAWGNDHHFHASTGGSAQAGPGRFCWVTDVRGGAFLNVTALDTVANAATQGAYDGSARGNARNTLLCPGFNGTVERPSKAKPCPPGALRDLAYGVLGPEAISITYIGPGGQRVTEPTRGPEGAYLIVARHSTTSCTASAQSRGLSCPSTGYGPELSAGIITKVTYRNGRVCRLPAPNPAGLVPQATCPLVGYQPPRAARPTAARLATPITLRIAPAAHHCASNAPSPAHCAQITLSISFIARVPVTTRASFYEAVIDEPAWHYKPGAAHGCPGYLSSIGAGPGVSGPSGTVIKAGQRVTWKAQLGSLTTDCRGAPLHVTVAYVADARLGLNGAGSEPMPSIGRGAIPVGHATTTLPTH